MTKPDGVEVVVRNDKVINIFDGHGSNRIPQDGYILSANGSKRQLLLENIALGDTVKIRDTVIPELVGDSNLWENLTHIIGGGPLLLRNGTESTSEIYEQEGFGPAFHSFWHPRTAVGKKTDGTLLFVTITGADPRVRRGVMMHKLARLFQKWGATDAVNLDGGSSAMMIIKNKVVSVKRKPPKRPDSEEKEKPDSPEKQTDKREIENKQDKQADAIAKDTTTERKKDVETKPDTQNKPVEEKTAIDRRTMSARGNRRIRTMPRFQGRPVSDAILIYPRKSEQTR